MSNINSTNSDLVLNATGGNDLVFQQDGIEKGRVTSAGFGKVLQIQETVLATEAAVACTVTVNTSSRSIISATITPTSATSKIKVEAVISGANNGIAQIFRLVRDIGGSLSYPADANATGQPSTFVTPYTSHVSMIQNASMRFTDSPNTILPITYYFDVGANTTSTVYFNRAVTPSTTLGSAISTITLTEIGV